MSEKEKIVLHIQRCWDFGRDEKPPYPTMEIFISDLRKEKATAKVASKVDTGFNGFLAISSGLVKKLGLKPFGTIPAATATAVAEVPIYRVLLTQRELNLSEKQVTALGTARNLAGRMLLKGNSWLMNFSNHKFYLVSASSEPKT